MHEFITLLIISLGALVIFTLLVVYGTFRQPSLKASPIYSVIVVIFDCMLAVLWATWIVGLALTALLEGLILLVNHLK